MPFKAFSILGEIGVRGHREARADLESTAQTATSTGRKVGAANAQMGRASTETASRLRDLGKAGTTASRGIERTGRSAQKAEGKFGGLIEGLGKAKLGYLALAAGAGTALSLIAKRSTEFDQRMRELVAVTGAGSDELGRLRTAALRAGVAMKVGGSEASRTLVALTRAGLESEEAIDALNATIAVGKISHIDLATAADVTVGVLRAFDLKASESSRVTDVLSYVANNTRVNFEGLAKALSVTGSTANSVGISLEKTAALVGALSNAGVAGESAGELIRTMFRKIEAATPPAIKRFKELGISLKDTEGNARDLFDVLKDLEQANVGLADTSLLFEAEYGAKVKAILDQGIPAIEELAEAAEKATGNTERMLKVMGSGVDGAMKKFKASVEDLKLTLSERGGLNEILIATLNIASKLTQTLSKSTRAMSNFNENLSEGRTIVDLGGTAQLTDKAFKQAIDRINEASFEMHRRLPKAMEAVAESSREAQTAIAGVADEVERLDAEKLFTELARAERAAENELRRLAAKRAELGVQGPIDTSGAPTISGRPDELPADIQGGLPNTPDALGRTREEVEAYGRVGVLTTTELEAAVERARRDVELIAQSSGATKQAVDEAVAKYEEAQRELEEAIAGRKQTDWATVLRGTTRRLGESMTEILFEQGGSFGSTWGERLTSLGKAFKRLFVREVAQGALQLGKVLLGISGGRGRRGAFDWLIGSTKTATKATNALFGSIDTGAAGSTGRVNKLARALRGLSAGSVGVAAGIAGKILDGINVAYKAVLKAIQKAGVAIWGAIKDVALAIWAPIKAVALAIWGPIKAAALAIWVPIKAAALALWPLIADAGKGIWAAIQAAGIKIWDGIGLLAKPIWAAIKAAGIAVWDIVKALAPPVWAAIKAAGVAVWDGVSALAGPVWDAIKIAGVSIWDAIKTVATSIWDVIKAAGEDFWRVLKKLASPIWDAIKALAGSVFDLLRPGANKLNDYLLNLSEAPNGGLGIPTARRPTEGAGGGLGGGGRGGGLPGVGGLVLGPIGAAVDLVTGVWSRFEANSDRNQANTYLKGIAQNQVTIGEHLLALGKRIEFVELAIRGTDGLQAALVNRFTPQWSGRILEYADDTLARLRLFHEFIQNILWAGLSQSLNRIQTVEVAVGGMNTFMQGTLWPGLQPAIGSIDSARQSLQGVKADTANLATISTGIAQVRSAVDGVRSAVLSLDLKPVVNVDVGDSRPSPIQQRDALDALDRALATPGGSFSSGSARVYSRGGTTSTSRSRTSSRTSSSRTSTARSR